MSDARVWNRGGTVKARETHEGDMTSQLHNQPDGERERNLEWDLKGI